MGPVNSTQRQHKRHGQIRKMCKLSCPEYCKNSQYQEIKIDIRRYTSWEFYDGTNEDNEWHPDNSINLKCIGKMFTISSINLNPSM